MLQNQFTRTKGKLLEMFIEMYKDMNTDERAIDYDEFYEELIPVVNQIQKLSNLNDLEAFCEEYGLNDMDNYMSFPNLVKQAYES
jgi:hypothetical protein